MKQKLLRTLSVLTVAAGCWGYADALAQDLTDGSYYIKNVKTGQFLVGGNAWGTHASLGKHGIDFILTQLPEGAYTLDSQIANNATNHYLGSDSYVDAGATNLTISGDGNGIYTITADGTNFLAANAENTIVAFGATSDDEYAQWQFLTREDMFALLDEATADNPVDATFFVKDPNFGRNDQRISAWNGSPAVGGDVTNYCAEKFNTSFDVYQTVSGVPAGKYKLYCQGFFRYGLPAAALAAHIDGTEVLETVLYANESEAPLMSIFNEDALNAILEQGITGGGWSTGEIDGVTYSYPNDMTSASAAFSAGLYTTSLDVVVGETGAIQMGFKKTTGSVPASNWTIFDNFEIYYLGLDEASIEAARMAMAHLQEKANEAINEASAILPEALVAQLNDLVVASDLSETPTPSEIATKTANLNDIVTVVGSYRESIVKAKTYLLYYPILPELREPFEIAIEESSNFSETPDFAELAEKTSMLEKAVAEVEPCVNMYTTLYVYTEKAKEIIASTNVFKQEDKDNYEAIIAEAEEMWREAVTPLDSVESFIKELLWNGKDYKPSSLLVRPFISSIWSGDVYTNTWSWEADDKENGSGMHTPFVEYWIGDAQTLGAKDITATITGLKEGNYKVTALVRVRKTDSAADAVAEGITLQVNDGEAVDVCAGQPCDDGAQFLYDNYVANGVVGADGVLNITFSVAEGNNISWLSFKNVNYEFGGATGIESVENAEEALVDVYSVEGIQVRRAVKASEALNGLHKGIYVVNGVKKVVK